MTLYQCDKCGKQVTDEYVLKVLEINIIGSDGDPDCVLRMDVCQQCETNIVDAAVMPTQESVKAADSMIAELNKEAVDDKS